MIKMVQASTNILRFHSSGTNLRVAMRYVAMVMQVYTLSDKRLIKSCAVYRIRELTFTTPICSVMFVILVSVDKWLELFETRNALETNPIAADLG